jgi:hypothetical protein
MSKLLVIAILLLPLISHGRDLSPVWVWDDKDFFKHCPPSQCSQHGPEIRYPFCLDSSNTSSRGCVCISDVKLVCSGQDTILVHPVLGPYNVIAIDYRHSSMKLIPLVDPCLVLQQKLIVSRGSSSPQVDDPKVVIDDEDPGRENINFWISSATLVCCSREFTPGAAVRIAGPVSCLRNATHFFYLAHDYEDMSLLPLDCKVVPFSDGSSGCSIPMYNFQDTSHQWFKESIERILNFAEQIVYWEDYTCANCELGGGRCAFSSRRLESFCIPNPHGMIHSNCLDPYI